MARIFIDLPEQFSFSTEIPLLYSHINSGGHLDNALLMSIVTEARVRYFVALGYSDENIEGLTAFTGDAAVQYLSEGLYGEVMVIEMAARDFNKYGCDFVFRVGDKASGREIARGKIGLVFYDRQAKKVAPIPTTFKAKVGA